MRAICVFLTFLAIAVCASENKPTNLAILDISAGQGVTSADAALIADRLETEFIKLGKFQVLERRRMNDILTE